MKYTLLIILLFIIYVGVLAEALDPATGFIGLTITAIIFVLEARRTANQTKRRR